MSQPSIADQIGGLITLSVLFLPCLSIPILMGFLCRSMAAGKYRDKLNWFVLGFFLGPVAVAALYFLPSLASISPTTGNRERVLLTIGDVRITSARLIESGRSYDIAQLRRAISHEDKLGRHTVVVYGVTGHYVTVIQAASLDHARQIRRSINLAIKYR